MGYEVRILEHSESGRSFISKGFLKEAKKVCDKNIEIFKDVISDKTPFIADLKPSGKYLMEDLHHVGGVPAVLKEMLQRGYLHGDCLTVTGKSIGENLESVKSLSDHQKIIVPFETPIKAKGHLQILYGNLAPDGAVAKITGK